MLAFLKLRLCHHEFFSGTRILTEKCSSQGKLWRYVKSEELKGLQGAIQGSFKCFYV